MEQGQYPNYGNYLLKKGCISDDALHQHWFIGVVLAWLSPVKIVFQLLSYDIISHFFFWGLHMNKLHTV